MVTEKTDRGLSKIPGLIQGDSNDRGNGHILEIFCRINRFSDMLDVESWVKKEVKDGYKVFSLDDLVAIN